jgi:hypothetical protein
LVPLVPSELHCQTSVGPTQYRPDGGQTTQPASGSHIWSPLQATGSAYWPSLHSWYPSALQMPGQLSPLRGSGPQAATIRNDHATHLRCTALIARERHPIPEAASTLICKTPREWRMFLRIQARLSDS